MLTLTISHFIYLSKEQRSDLLKKIPIDVIGVSVPVWFKLGTTSEPAKEIFCRYIITNDEKETIVEKNNDGYAINLPQKISFKNTIQKDIISISAVLNLANADQLADFPNGDSGVLEFVHQKDDKNLSLIHFIEIKGLEKLTETFC